jgi:GntR family transcriptional regulator
MSLSGHHYNLQGPGRGVQRHVNIPFYEQLKQVLLAQINGGEYQPGDLLPSEHELCDTYGVSRTVVRQALGELVNEGRLFRMRGKGTFVAKPKLNEQFIESTVGFFEDLTSRGHVVESHVMSCELIKPTAAVAEALELPDGAQCVELVRVRSVNDEVLAFTRSYLPYFSQEFYEDLRDADLSKVSLYHFLEDKWGIRIESGHRSLEAILANAMLARMLKIRSRDPVLSIESIGRNSNDQVVEYFQAWHRADRTRLEMDVVRSARPHAAPAA